VPEAACFNLFQYVGNAVPDIFAWFGNRVSSGQIKDSKHYLVKKWLSPLRYGATLFKSQFFFSKDQLCREITSVHSEVVYTVRTKGRVYEF
jgi:hypothetical protein